MSQSLDTIVTVEQVVCGETFLIRYERRYSATALRVVARYVHDPRVPFDWIDAAKVSREIVAISEEACKGK